MKDNIQLMQELIDYLNYHTKLYDEGKIFSEPAVNYEFSKTFAHVLIQLQTNDVEEVLSEIKSYIGNIKREGIDINDFERAKKFNSKLNINK